MPPSSPEQRFPQGGEYEEHHENSRAALPEVEEDGIHPSTAHDQASVHSDHSETSVRGCIDEPPDVRSRLLDFGHKYHLPHNCGEYNCTHGTFSPRPRRVKGYGSIASDYDGPAGETEDDHSESGFGGRAPGHHHDSSGRVYRGDFVEGTFGDAVADGLLGKPSNNSTTHWLARRHRVRNERWMYVQVPSIHSTTNTSSSFPSLPLLIQLLTVTHRFLSYYFPFARWIRQYRLHYLQGDLVAALTMASFYIPMSLSYASNLAHVPPINGLYSFVFNPVIYALLGTCPQMVVGPEAAGSLLTGSVVKEAISRGMQGDHEGQKHAQIAGMVTGLAGAIILLAGLCRLGFLDGVLSRPFLRGFISAIGIVILVDQLIPEMGLDTAAAHSDAGSHGSSLDKILFLFRHSHEVHKLTCAVSFSTIAIVLVMREMKHRLQPRMHWVAYIPDRFVVVVLSAVFAWKFDWKSRGLDVLGDIRSQGRPFRARFPFAEGNFRHVDDAFSTAFIIALLGFFESSVAAKSLGAGGGEVKKRIKRGKEVEESDGIRGITVSANRELVALGVANLLGGLFMALPAFGGYGRSKVNASTGGKTPMSSVFLSLITVICIVFLLPYFYYIPVSIPPSHFRAELTC